MLFLTALGGAKSGRVVMVGSFRRFCACMVAAGSLLLSGTFESRAAADDAKTCAKDSGEIAIDGMFARHQVGPLQGARACAPISVSRRRAEVEAGFRPRARGLWRGSPDRQEIRGCILQSLRHLQSQGGLRSRYRGLQSGDQTRAQSQRDGGKPAASVSGTIAPSRTITRSAVLPTSRKTITFTRSWTLIMPSA